jgi:hypothetical protein
MNNHFINVSVIITLFLFSITLLLSCLFTNDHRFALAEQQKAISASNSNQSNRILGAIASNLFGSDSDSVVAGHHPPIYNQSESKPDAQAKGLFTNDHRFALAEQQKAISASNSNQSNRILGAIASNLWANNPDAVVAGHHPPIYNQSESKPDAPAKEKGFLVASAKPVNVSYPSEWIKNKGMNMQFTGVHSIPIITFLIPDFEATTSKSNFVGIAKYIIGGNHTAAMSLSNYVIEELKELESDGSFHLYESHLDRIGQNRSLAQRIVYATNIVDNSPVSGAEVIGHRKTMEVITVNNGTAYFFVYSADANRYPVYMAEAFKMLNSLEIK